jgi:hypothetical protein
MKNVFMNIAVAGLVVSSFAAHAATKPPAAVQGCATAVSEPALGALAKSATRPVAMLAATRTVEVSFAHGVEERAMQHLNNPSPVLLNVTNVADFLPANLRDGVSKCNILGEGVIEEKGARPYVRTENFSCFDQSGNLVAKGWLSGYLVGTDGILGLPSADLKVGEKASVVVDHDTRIFRADN